ncbi:hypothetical protein ANCCAN_25102 [Ancylostoma caninum]|uniref:Uncharacterized protein n=1 Tax=Ancylostoma caninum TaxID=29170 RepID=A0A368FAF1_ANCCA|nr:hypothetical protein ANCCAN_25102 [Ancylostoma caninum]
MQITERFSRLLHELPDVRHGAEDPDGVDVHQKHQNPHRVRRKRSNRRRIRRREHGRYADKARFGCVRGGVAGVESAGSARQKAEGRPPPCRSRRSRRSVVSSPRTAPCPHPCCYPSAPHPAARTTAQPARFRMPVFQLHTNVAQNKVTPDLLKQISELVARILHKPESVRASSAF